MWLSLAAMVEEGWIIQSPLASEEILRSNAESGLFLTVILTEKSAIAPIGPQQRWGASSTVTHVQVSNKLE